ncbi:MAG: hypothetical protein AABX11_07535 [Nanoarchaeota archaeon]
MNPEIYEQFRQEFQLNPRVEQLPPSPQPINPHVYSKPYQSNIIITSPTPETRNRFYVDMTTCQWK